MRVLISHDKDELITYLATRAPWPVKHPKGPLRFQLKHFFSLYCVYFPLSSNNSTGEENFLLQSQLKKNNKISIKTSFRPFFPLYVLCCSLCVCDSHWRNSNKQNWTLRINCFVFLEKHKKGIFSYPWLSRSRFNRIIE